jgi:hypothetical protein
MQPAACTASVPLAQRGAAVSAAVHATGVPQDVALLLGEIVIRCLFGI